MEAETVVVEAAAAKGAPARPIEWKSQTPILEEPEPERQKPPPEAKVYGALDPITREMIIVGTLLTSPQAPVEIWSNDRSADVSCARPEWFEDARLGQLFKALLEYREKHKQRCTPEAYAESLALVESKEQARATQEILARCFAALVMRRGQNPVVLVDNLRDRYFKKNPDAVGKHDAAVHWSEMTCSKTPAPTPDLWSGLVKLRSKLFLGGPSKARKTWALIGLAVSVATGRRYWGHDVVKGGVLYLNMEIKTPEFGIRLNEVRSALGITAEGVATSDLRVLSLRGKGINGVAELADRVKAEAARAPLSLIVLDPLYKIYGTKNENDAAQMTQLCNELDMVAERHNVTLVVGLHFPKGNSAAKEAIDRTSGSGVFGRDPDTIMNLTPHEEDDTLVAEIAGIRDHAPVEPFGLRWEFPLLRRDDEVDTTKLKASGAKAEPLKEADVLKALGGDRRDLEGVVQLVKDEKPKVGIQRINTLVRTMARDGTLSQEKTGQGGRLQYWNPRASSPEKPEPPPEALAGPEPMGSDSVIGDLE